MAAPTHKQLLAERKELAQRLSPGKGETLIQALDRALLGVIEATARLTSDTPGYAAPTVVHPLDTLPVIKSNPLPDNMVKPVEPGAPAMSAVLGDMTPEYLNWFCRSHSQPEIQAKYGERIHLLPVELQSLMK